jgi:hypothetical protein
MKVFISWSGDTSKDIAEILRGWLPSVIQAIKPYYSPDDITKGSRWSTEISKELEECKIGLLCLTADNLEAPWVMFEAGALSKSLSAARVCPLLFGIEPSDIKGPLVQFQAAPFAKDEMKKAVRMMNQELGPTALTTEVLDSVFEMWWPKLEEKIKAVLSSVKTPGEQTVRSERDILEEILARVRVSAPSKMMRGAIHPEAIDDLVENLDRLMLEVNHLPLDARGEFGEIIEALRMSIEYIVHRSGFNDELLSPRRRLPDLGLTLVQEEAPQKERVVKRVRRPLS